MNSIIFKDIELSDAAWIRELFSAQDFNSEDYNFTYQYLWRNTFKSKVARIGDLVLIQYNMEGRKSYLFPAGRADQTQIAELIEYMLACGSTPNQLSDSLLNSESKLVFYGVLPQQLALLEKHFAGRFTSEQIRMGADYIYDAESLKTLKGKKYQSKRNFANGFRKNYNWHFEPITGQNLKDCLEMNDEWCRRGGCKGDFWKNNEFCATKVALNNLKALGLDGALLRVDGKVVAFTIGERANSNTLLVHIEKALTEYRGAYQAMSQEFLNYMDTLLKQRGASTESKTADSLQNGRLDCLQETPAFTLVNREDDSGDENLRRAKLEYHPVEIKEKYLVTFNSQAG